MAYDPNPPMNMNVNLAASSAGTFTEGGSGGGFGMPYCLAPLNSIGAPSELTAAGSAFVADNDVTLMVGNLPPNVFGFFITSQAQGLVANSGGSEGNLCLTGSIGGYVGPGQLQQADSGGFYSLTIDLTATPQPLGPVSIVAGENWNFQSWHRDTNMSGSTSNLTNGLEITFN